MARVPRPWRRKDVGGAWYAQVDRRKVWLAPADATKAEAQKRLHELLAAKGKPGKSAGAGLSTHDVLNLFAAKIEGEVARGETAADTLTRYQQFLDSADEQVGTIPADQLRPADVQTWLDAETGWGTTTRRHAVSLVKTAFRHARRFGHISEDPLAEMPKPEGKRREAIMTAAQVETLLAAIPDQEFHDLVTALRRTGCRPSEVMSLTTDRIDVETRTWRVVDKIRKKTGQVHRTVYLDDVMVELSRRLIARHPSGVVFRNTRGRPYTRVTVAHRFERLARKLGFGEECTAYSLRHLYITDALENGMSPATVAELVGHRDMKMVMQIYSHLSERADHLRDAARSALPGALAVPRATDR